MEFQLSEKQRQELIYDIQRFFREERNEEIGVIAAEHVLSTLMASMVKRIYNSALDDVKAWWTKRADDLDYEFDGLYR